MLRDKPVSEQMAILVARRVEKFAFMKKAYEDYYLIPLDQEDNKIRAFRKCYDAVLAMRKAEEAVSQRMYGKYPSSLD